MGTLMCWLVAALVVLGAPDPRPASERRVVLITPSDDEQASLLVDSVKAQLADVDTEVVVVSDEPEGVGVGDRFERATTLAQTHDAMGVFWLEPGAGSSLLIYLVDGTGGRALLRRLERDPDSEGATLEAVAIIVRASTVALIEGRAIGMEVIEEESELPRESEPPKPQPDPQPPKAQDPPTPPKRERGRGRVGVAYAGAGFAPQAGARWQNGLGLALAWEWRIGLYAGVGYTVYPPWSDVLFPIDETLDNIILVEISRNPIAAIGGYHRSYGRFGVDAELALVVDLTRTRGTPQQPLRDVVLRTDYLATVGLEPRLRGLYQPLPYLALSLALGAEIMLYNALYREDWVAADGVTVQERQNYLTPYFIRPTLQAGVLFFI